MSYLITGGCGFVGSNMAAHLIRKGETVTVLDNLSRDGAFANLTGRVDEIDPARGKLKISVSIFGRFTPVELEYWQVQRASES